MKLIDKSALVAEIERWINHYNLAAKEFGDEGYKDNVLMEQCKASACERILSFLNTLEVKDVDLEKEIEKYAYSLPHSVTGTTSYVSDIKAPIAREFGVKHGWSYEYVEQIAEHFYELGLKAAQKRE